MFGDLTRDMRWTNHGADTAFSTGEVAVAGVPAPHLTPTIVPTLAEMTVNEAVAVSAGMSKSVGVAMMGPDERKPDRTPYMLNGRFFIDGAGRLALFEAVAAAAPMAVAAGQAQASAKWLQASIGGVLEIESLICEAPYPTPAHEDRAIVFGIAVENPGDADATLRVRGS